MSYTPGTEVANFPEGSQFENGESPQLCVFFGVADIAASSPAGSPIGQSWEWVDQKADSLANQVQGNGAFKNSQGASTSDEYNALKICNLKYIILPISPTSLHKDDIQNIKDSINNGRPVLLTGKESGFIDSQINAVPYGWRPLENHCLVVTGYDLQDNLIVRDYANVGHAWMPGSRRVYLSEHMDLISGTSVLPYWEVTSMVPNGWKLENDILIDPNGLHVVMGFKDYILNNNWDPDNVALDLEYGVDQVQEHNTSLGKGTRQEFIKSVLWWTEDKGVINEPNLGLEISTLYKELNILKSQIGSAKIPDNIQKFIVSTSNSMKDFSDAVSKTGLDSTAITALIKLISDISNEVSKLN